MIEPQKWASTLGSLSDTVTLPDEDLQFASFKKLFPALTQVPLSEGGVAPQRTDFNTLFKLLGDNIFYIQQGGVFSYSDTADYERGAFVKYNNELYLCIQDNSSSNKHAPTDAEYWLRVALNNDLANYLPLAGGNITGNLTVQNKNVATEDFVNTSINNLNIIRKNNGNDYYDDSDITSLIYAGNGAGTLRAQIAQGDFRNVHPGDYIIGKSTGTKWIVAHNDYWFNRGDSPLTRHHLCLIPEILAGNSGNLLWSGRTYAGSGVNNTDQGYAPWASDNWSEGKNNTSGAYYNSFIKQSILPKVYTYWLKKDFEDQGISLLTFRNLLSNATNTNTPVKGYSAWSGASSSWAWYDSKCDLLSEANVYGNNHWQSSGFDCSAQKEQLALFKFRHTLEVWGRKGVWFQDVASSSLACACGGDGGASPGNASSAFVVAPFCLIA